MHDLLFSEGVAEDDDGHASHAERLGLDSAAFRSCLDDPAASTRVRRDLASAEALGISGTPTFLIGTMAEPNSMHVTRILSGTQPLSVFIDLIDQLLARAAVGQT
jgi:predicted DsbA family dithiol-disulfide isomerase